MKQAELEWRRADKDETKHFLGLKLASGRTVFVNFDKPVIIFAGEEYRVGWRQSSNPHPRFSKKHPITGRWLWCGMVPPTVEVVVTVWTRSGKEKTHYRYGEISDACEYQEAP